MNATEALQRSALFKDFSETGIKIFAEIAQRRAIPAGTPLFVENMVGESLFIVVTGTVKVVQSAPDGDRELATLGAGEHLGEMALLGRTVRLVSAIAATPCEVIELTHRDFFRKATEKPAACLKLALAITAAFSARVAECRDLLRELARTAR